MHREECRKHEGVSGESSDRLDLILDNAGRFRGFDAPDVFGPEPQIQIHEHEPQPAEQPFAENAFGDVDVELEGPIDDDQRQEESAQSPEKP